jgi:hypothetical protein
MFGDLFPMILFFGGLVLWAYLTYLSVQALRAIQNIDRSLYDVARTLRNQNPMDRAHHGA